LRTISGADHNQKNRLLSNESIEIQFCDVSQHSEDQSYLLQMTNLKDKTILDYRDFLKESRESNKVFNESFLAEQDF